MSKQELPARLPPEAPARALNELSDEQLEADLFTAVQRAEALQAKLMQIKDEYIATVLTVEALENRVRTRHDLPPETSTAHQVVFNMTAYKHNELPAPRFYPN